MDLAFLVVCLCLLCAAAGFVAGCILTGVAEMKRGRPQFGLRPEEVKEERL